MTGIVMSLFTLCSKLFTVKQYFDKMENLKRLNVITFGNNSNDNIN
jgi:hypothetical protein